MQTKTFFYWEGEGGLVTEHISMDKKRTWCFCCIFVEGTMIFESLNCNTHPVGGNWSLGEFLTAEWEQSCGELAHRSNCTGFWVDMCIGVNAQNVSFIRYVTSIWAITMSTARQHVPALWHAVVVNMCTSCRKTKTLWVLKKQSIYVFLLRFSQKRIFIYLTKLNYWSL